MRMPAQIKPMVIHRRNAFVAEGSQVIRESYMHEPPSVPIAPSSPPW